MINKFGLLFFLAASQFLPAAIRKPNIVFLLVDDLGRGDFGCYGARFHETPNLDDGKPGDYLTDRLTDEAVAFLDRSNRDTLFLLYFSYYTVHGPMMAPSALVEKGQGEGQGFQERQERGTESGAGRDD